MKTKREEIEEINFAISHLTARLVAARTLRDDAELVGMLNVSIDPDRMVKTVGGLESQLRVMRERLAEVEG